jgi:hypothetical protein
MVTGSGRSKKDDASVTEQCAKCSAPLADDQRYCLQCGEPRPHVSGPPSRTPATPTSPPAPPVVPAIPSASPNGRNNTLALLAGIGVLLLAMGVGVLIGRAEAGSAKVPPAQVISVGGAAAASSTTATTPTTTTTETPAAGTPKKAAKSKAASSSSNAGSSITKPAPPTVLKSVSKGQSGSSYEQKSKNLPNVVETG